MRPSTVASVLFAAGVLSTPVLDRRAVVTEEVVVTLTHYVTIGGDTPTTSSSTTSIKPMDASPSPKVQVAGYKPHSHYHYHQAPKPIPKPVTSTPEAVVPTSTTEKAYVPPTTSSTKAAPVTTEAPVKSTPAASNDDLPTTKVSGLSSDSEIYKGLTLQHHNVHRTNHSVAALEWNQTLADFAKQTAQTCIWGHSL